ncbi:MAG: hypothetical protein V2I33_26475, partial [Kangiellaceae bacterium]|nr:hypothetical protein [Kangiellaceae bacterium]
VRTSIRPFALSLSLPNAIHKLAFVNPVFILAHTIPGDFSITELTLIFKPVWPDLGTKYLESHGKLTR